MFNITSKFVSVFQPEIKSSESGKVLFANLSTYKKSTDANGNVSYINMSWNGRFVGEAFNRAKNLKHGDKIDILNGIIENKYDNIKKRLYVTVTVFDFAVTDTSKNNRQGEEH